VPVTERPEKKLVAHLVASEAIRAGEDQVAWRLDLCDDERVSRSWDGGDYVPRREVLVLGED